MINFPNTYDTMWCFNIDTWVIPRSIFDTHPTLIYNIHWLIEILNQPKALTASNTKVSNFSIFFLTTHLSTQDVDGNE